MAVQPLLQYDVEYPDRLSRLLIFVKWLVIIPHAIVLSILGIGLYLTTIIAWFAILFTGRYPRGLFDFAVTTLRWNARVNAYALLQRDDYPPFGDGPYPVRFELDYPERLSRLLIFVKWLLLIPHLVVFYFVAIALSVVNLIAWVAILFTGRYPRGLFDFTTGGMRWAYRIATYALLLTDAYPPFTMASVQSPTSGTGYAPAPASW